MLLHGLLWMLLSVLFIFLNINLFADVSVSFININFVTAEPAQGEVGQSSSEEPIGHIGDNMLPSINVTVSHDMPPPSG